MRKFETLLLLSPELSTEQRESLIAGLANIIGREGGKVLVTDHWGMRDLAYPVRKNMRGYYLRYEYELIPSAVAEFERNIRLNENIYKFLTVRLDEDLPAKTEEVA